MKTLKVLLCLLSFLIVADNPLLARDSHYWVEQYGTRANLLGGLVVGSIEDLSSTYYNPAVLSFTTDQNLLLTADAFQIQRFNYENSLLEGLEMNKIMLTPSPAIIAYRLPLNVNSKNQFAISYLNRFDNKFYYQESFNSIGDNDNSYNKNSSEALFDYRINEYWGGFSWAYKISDRFSFGLTQYISYRYQTMRNQFLSSDFSDSSGFDSQLIIDDYNYYNVRALTKIGVFSKLNQIELGFNISLPSINLFGSGETDVMLQSIRTDAPDSSLLLANSREDVDAKYRTPLSVALGATYRFENTVIYFTTEYFTNLNEYSVFAPMEVPVSDDDAIVIQYNHAFQNILNFGIGLQYKFNDDLSYFGAVHTDFSAQVPETNSKFSRARYDLYHINSGVSFRLSNVNITLGLSYCFGGGENDYTLINESDLVDIDLTYHEKTQYQGLKIIFGFSLFNKAIAEELPD